VYVSQEKKKGKETLWLASEAKKEHIRKWREKGGKGSFRGGKKGFLEGNTELRRGHKEEEKFSGQSKGGCMRD